MFTRLSKSHKNNRHLSFTFDDGLIQSARKVDKMLGVDRATFYIVTGWLRPMPLAITDSYNIGYDHGDFHDWQVLSDRGHDIQSHTVSHILPDDVNADWEYEKSLNFIKRFHDGPYSLAAPKTVKIIKKTNYDSIRIGEGDNIYNDINNIDWRSLISWGLFEHGLRVRQIIKQLRKIPDNSWLILRMHGLDGEGFCPADNAVFKKIYDEIINLGYKIKTVREMTSLFKPN